MRGNLYLSHLKESDDGHVRRFGAGSLYYDVDVEDAANRFGSSSGRVTIDGGFYGPAHEEMAGTVVDEGKGLLAAFGGASSEWLSITR